MSPSWAAPIASLVAVVLIGLGLLPRLTQVRGQASRTIRPRRPTELSDDDLIAFLDAAAAAIRAGESVTAAVEHASRGDPRLATLLRDPPSTPGQQLAAQAIELAGEVGGHVAATLDGAASVLRQRQAIAAEARTHSAQARLSARVLTWLPIGFAGLIASGDSGRATLGSPLGLICMAVGAGLNAVGWLWMRRLIRRAQR